MKRALKLKLVSIMQFNFEDCNIVCKIIKTIQCFFAGIGILIVIFCFGMFTDSMGAHFISQNPTLETHQQILFCFLLGIGLLLFMFLVFIVFICSLHYACDRIDDKMNAVLLAQQKTYSQLDKV